MSDRTPEIIVECRVVAGRGEVPARFGQPGQMREVVKALDRWDGSDHRYFRVRAEDGCEYILRHDLRDGVWQIHFFSQRDAPGVA